MEVDVKWIELVNDRVPFHAAMSVILRPSAISPNSPFFSIDQLSIYTL
jgi:hypothetical protein